MTPFRKWSPRVLAQSRIAWTFHELCQAGTDISEHLPALSDLAWEVGGEAARDEVEVVELGVRSAVSTVGFLHGLSEFAECYPSKPIDPPPRLVSVDIAPMDPTQAERLAEVSAACGLDWRFVLGSSLEVPVVPCVALFVDTLHDYAQLRAELMRWGPSVSRWIALHDTETFGTRDESGDGPGLRRAVGEFLEASGGEWTVVEDRRNCNGLMILRRGSVG